jgi:hypothetical protein
MTGPARLALSIALMLPALSACEPPPEPSVAPLTTEPTLEQLYTAGRYAELVVLAAATISSTPDAEILAHARFFRAMAWLAQDERAAQARAFLELRELELQFSDYVWGRIAAAYAAKIVRGEILQEALLECTLDLRALEQEFSELEQRHAETVTALTQREAKQSSLEHEREQLRKQLEEAQVKINAAAARVFALEEELAALKQVDMQRDP